MTKKFSAKLLSALSVALLMFGFTAVTPVFGSTPFGIQQAQAATKKPKTVTKKDSKGRVVYREKTTYYSSGKEKQKEVETDPRIVDGGKSAILLTSTTTKYSESGKITSETVSQKYRAWPYSLERITTSTYKKEKLSKKVVAKYANRPSFVPADGSTVKSDKKVTLEEGFLLNKTEYTYSPSGKRSTSRVWSPYHQKLVAPEVKKSVKVSQKRAKLVKEAKKLLGNPYRIGPAGSLNGKGPYSFDCSGYVSYVYYKSLNVDLSTSPAGQNAEGKLVTTVKSMKDYSKLKVGDILIFKKGSKVTHTAIYIGVDKNGKHQYIEATTGPGVRVNTVKKPGSRYAPDSIRRII